MFLLLQKRRAPGRNSNSMKTYQKHLCRAGFVSSLLAVPSLEAGPAVTLFQDDFNEGIPGWIAVQPAGNYSGSLLWQFDINSGALWENSNIFSDSSAYSSTRAAPMLINETAPPASNFTYTVRLRASDDDGCGLIWAYQNPTNFYRVTFAAQGGASTRNLWPHTGWDVDRVVNGEYTDLFGRGSTNLYTPFTFTLNRFFDVTIGLTNGLFSLTVIDDPTNASPTVYLLVDNQPLPTVQAGKVGLFTWGMSVTLGDGLPNVGIRYLNPTLVPIPLTGQTNPLAGVWTTLVTPRGDGSTNLPAIPVWNLALNANGSNSRLRESSGTFLASDNVAAGTTNFAAASIVAGDVNWSNYIYSARLIPSDDDGYGLLLRFKDLTNWYRIAFRAQNSLSGAKKGISIQKCVNGVFDQIFADASTYIPTLNVPADVYASISTNRLQVTIVSNPGNPAQAAFNFGPFDITGSTVDSGQIGLFSWAQQSIDIDFARVQSVTGQGLLLASAFGVPNPPVGLNDLPSGGSVTASVDSIVNDAPGVRRVLIGWNGSGSVPPTGTTNSLTFTLNSFSFLEWKWRTEYQLTLGVTGNGQVTPVPGPWVADGTAVNLSAVAAPGNIFVGWSGDSLGSLTNLSFTMNRPRTLTANFAADSDGDGLPDSWEALYFGSLSQNASGDPDGDGISNLNEFLRGTNPKQAEALVVSDGLISQWINTQRDPLLGGELYVVDFGSGYRGAFDTSNDFRYGDDTTFINASNVGAYASFQSPIVVVKSNLWDVAWGTNFSASMEITVGDNDGACFYFRYVDELNWYRVTLCGEPEASRAFRPYYGLSVQRRLSGNYTNLLVDPTFFTDPLDQGFGAKRLKLTVNATNENFEVRAVRWNFSIPDFDPGSEVVEPFSDTGIASGRIGFGQWGQGVFSSAAPDTSANGIPIPSGTFFDNIQVKAPADGLPVFSETWETAALMTNLPAGWSNPYSGTNEPLVGDWRVTAHGTIVQQSNIGPTTSGTTATPRADADSPMLLAPDPIATNYFLRIGFHPFDNDGVGFVYDFQDTNNFSRVMFRQEATFDGAIPPGLNVSRKSGGVWTNIVAADPAFLYTPGRPFEIEFANNNGFFSLLARDLDFPTNVVRWHWTGPASTTTNRFGVAAWSSTDAHFLYAQASSLPLVDTTLLKITQISFSGGNVILDISRPSGATFNVERASAVGGPYNPVALGQTGVQYSEPIPAATAYYRLVRVP